MNSSAVNLNISDSVEDMSEKLGLDPPIAFKIKSPTRSAIVLIGGLMVIISVTLEQGVSHQSSNPSAHPLSALRPYSQQLFTGGWILVASGISSVTLDTIKDEGGWIRPVTAFGGTIGVLLSVMNIMKAKSQGQEPTTLFKYMFPIAWLAVGLSSTMDKSGKFSFKSTKYIFGMTAPVLVLLSMLYFLPKERALKMTDNIGSPLFTMGWGLLSIAAGM